MTTDMIVNLVISGLLVLFVLFGMFWGVVRGLKRTAIRSVWLIVTALLLILFLSSAITNALMNISFTIEVTDGVFVEGFDGLAEYLMQESGIDVSNLGENLDVAIKTIVSYCALLLNSIVFVFLFWIFKIFLLPVNWALSKWVFLSKKEREYRRAVKEYKKALKEYNKESKGKTKLKAMGFASSDDNEVLEENLQEVRKSSALESLRNARKRYNDMLAREGKLNITNNVAEENPEEANELLDRPYVEPKMEETKQEEFVPKEEYKPVEEPKKEEEVKVLKRPKKPQKLKKHRFLGMLVGGVVGLFVGAITISPVIGVLNLANDINSNNKIELESSEKVGIIDYITDNMFSEINGYYRNSYGANVLKYSGGEWVADTTFKALTSGKIDGESANLTKDITAIVAIANEVNVVTKKIETAENNNYQVNTLSEIITSINTIVDNMFDISIVSILIPTITDVGAMLIDPDTEKNANAIRGGGEESSASSAELDLNEILKTTADVLRTIDSSDKLEKELKSLLSIVTQLNNGVSVKDKNNQTVTTSLLSEMLKQTYETDEDSKLLKTVQKLNYDYYRTSNKYYFADLINNFYDYEGYSPVIATNILPYGVDYLLKLILNELGLETVAEGLDHTSNEDAKAFAINTVSEVFAILFELNTYYNEQDELIYKELNDDIISSVRLQDLNINIFTSLGKIVDGLVDLVDEEVYQDVVASVADMTTELLKSMFEGLIGEEKSEKLCNSISLAIKESDQNGWFENEFASIGKMFNYLFVGDSITDENGNVEVVKPLIAGEHSLSDTDSWSYEINNFAIIGKLINSMQETAIFKYKPDYLATGIKVNNLTYFVDSLLGKVKEDRITAIKDSGESVTLDSNNYISEVTSVDGLLYNVINTIQINLLGEAEVEKNNGAFNWSKAIEEDSLFIKTIDTILKTDSEKLLDFDDENSVISIILKYNKKTTISKESVNQCALDELKNNNLLKGVAKRIVSDLGSILNTSIEDNEAIANIVNPLINSLKNVESSSNKHDTYYNYLYTINQAVKIIYINDELTIDLESPQGMQRLGAFVEKLTSSYEGATPLISDTQVVSVINEVVDTEFGKIEVDGKFKEPLDKLVNDLTSTLEEKASKENANIHWEDILLACYEISDEASSLGSIGDMSSDSIDSMQRIINIMTGRKFLVQGIDGEISTQLVTDTQAKEFLIAMIGNYLNDDSTEGVNDSIKTVMFAVKEAVEPEVGNLEALNSLLYHHGELIDTPEYRAYDAFKENTYTGILENIYNYDTTTNGWSTIFNNIKEMLEIDDISLGRFAVDSKHTYDSGKTEEDGIGSKLDSILSQSNAILTINHVIEIVKSEVNDLDFGEAGAIKSEVINNLDKLIIDIERNKTLDYELKTAQYMLDIAESNIDTFDWGVYLDEIKPSQLFGNIGTTLLKDQIDKKLLDSTNGITSTITEEKISYHVEKLITSVRDNLDTVSVSYDWVEIFAGLKKLNNLIMTSSGFSNFDTALDNLSTILNVLNGKSFEVDSTSYKVEFVGVDVAKDFVLGIIASNARGEFTDEDGEITNTEIYNVIYNVNNSTNLTELNNKFAELTGDNKIQFVNNSEIASGVIENLFSVNNNYIKENDNYWTNICTSLKEIINISSVSLGKFSNTDSSHTLYDSDFAGETGVGSILDDIIGKSNASYKGSEISAQLNKDGKDTLITLDQVKDIISSKIDLSETDTEGMPSYVTGIINTIKANVANLDNESDLDKEFKSVQYFIDIAYYSKGSDMKLVNIGIHLDEILDSTLVGNIGETMVVGALDSYLVDTSSEDDLKDRINTITANVNKFMGTTNYEFFKEETVKTNISSIYNTNRTTPNTDVFGAVAEIEAIVKGMNFSVEISKANIDTAITKANELSINLQKLQSNILVGVIETRYIAVALMQQLADKLDALYMANSVPKYSEQSSTASKPAHYSEVYKPHFESNITKAEAETYADENNGEYSITPTNVTSTLATDANYILVKILYDFKTMMGM